MTATLMPSEPGIQSPLSLTAVILTKNEQSNIGDCLRCLDWVLEIVVVDSFSTDRTLEIVREVRPDAHIVQNQFEDFGQQRNFAIDSVPGSDWLLFLDADERCTPELAAEIRQVIREDDGVAGCFLTCRNIFLNKWIRRCTMYPSWQLRLLRNGRVRYQKEGHGQKEIVNGPVRYLQAPYDHLGFSQGITHWIARHNRYSSDEVELILRLRGERLRLTDLFRSAIDRRRAMKRLAARTGWLRPWIRFIFLYIIRLGFLDGRAGLIFCLLRLSHEIHIVAKVAEAKIRETK